MIVTAEKIDEEGRCHCAGIGLMTMTSCYAMAWHRGGSVGKQCLFVGDGFDEAKVQLMAMGTTPVKFKLGLCSL